MSIGEIRVPNLDDIDDRDLDLALALFDKLTQYCFLRQQSRLARFQGRVTEAMDLEAYAELIYHGFPEHIKW